MNIVGVPAAGAVWGWRFTHLQLLLRLARGAVIGYRLAPTYRVPPRQPRPAFLARRAVLLDRQPRTG
jgi:hypothetical protein